MKERFRCVACGASYWAVQADGTLYFHACALLLDPKTGLFVRRAGHRDENIDPKSVNTVPSIVSEGKGVKPIAPNRLLEPTWLTMFKRAVPAEEED